MLKENGKVNSSVAFTSKVVSLHPCAERKNDTSAKDSDLEL